MEDQPEREQTTGTIRSFELHVECGEGDWWYVISPTIRGILAAGPTVRDALQEAVAAIETLEAFKATGQSA